MLFATGVLQRPEKNTHLLLQVTGHSALLFTIEIKADVEQLLAIAVQF